jgi:hypothetical protein
VIRFSAALVAVAIGVLIGGIATSELVLVYIAIVVSAVALVALAIGVLLSRDELFGEIKGIAPAGAGASPGPSDRSGEGQDRVPSAAQVTPPLPFPGAAVGYAGAFGATAQAAPSPAGADLSATRPVTAVGTGRAASPVPPWESPAREPWPPSAQRDRAGARAQPAWQDPAPGGAAGGLGATGADTRPAPAVPRSWAAPPSSPVVARTVSADPLPADASAAEPGSGSGSTPPSWFDRLGNPAGAKPADTSTSGAEDDDWPTRYSWLEDETDETGGTGEADAAVARPEDERPVPEGAPGGAGHPDAGDDESAQPAAATVAAPVLAGPSGDDSTGDSGSAGAGRGSNLTADITASESAGPAAEADADDAASAEEGVSSHGDPDAEGRAGAPGQGAEAAGETDAASEETVGEPPAGSGTDLALVAVVRGVRRYHQPDCVLIRFMPEGDVQKLTIPQATEEGCTPCTACQLDG